MGEIASSFRCAAFLAMTGGLCCAAFLAMTAICHCEEEERRRSNLVYAGDCFVASLRYAPRNDGVEE